MIKLFITVVVITFSFFSCCENESEDVKPIETEYISNCELDFIFLDENDDDLIDLNDESINTYSTNVLP